MNAHLPLEDQRLDDPDQLIEPVRFRFNLDRRRFVQMLGAGLMVVAAEPPLLGQRRGGFGGGGPRTVSARLHLGKDGRITVLTGKVEVGQGARAEITQAAADELRVPVDRIELVMADTALVPDDGITAGSMTTPRTIPSVRQAAAAARELLAGLACQRWGLERDKVEVREGKITRAGSSESVTYAELAATEDAAKAFANPLPTNIELTPVKEWKVMGTSLPRPNRRDLVTGAHRYSSDVVRPKMLHGKVLRQPSFGAKLTGVDLGPAKAMKDVVVLQDGTFVGVAAPTTFQASQALRAIAPTATWEPAPHPSSKELFAHLKQHARGDLKNPFETELAAAAKVLRQTYRVAYVQHAPLETRAAVAEWEDGKLTVWSGTQNPFGYRGELERTFRLQPDQVRVITPDTGGGFGGKHTGEVAVEAARLAQAAGRPVGLKWTREEEFTWACFRPAALIEAEAGLDAQGALQVWHFVNINSGGSAVESPYRIPHSQSRFVDSQALLRHGSYRGLAATANNFAREAFMDELAAAAGSDSLEFRLAHLENGRLRAVLEAAAKRFGWKERKARCGPNTGVGLACGTEKGSYVAACVEVAVDPDRRSIQVRHVCEVFECGAVLNPNNLTSQVQGAIIMGLGPALREAMEFENGQMLNASFEKCIMPHFRDVPELDLELLNRPDLPPAGGGETPIIAIAPAIANALFQATGERFREMPMRWPAPAKA